jgi:hypothetical protein
VQIAQTGEINPWIANQLFRPRCLRHDDTNHISDIIKTTEFEVEEEAKEKFSLPHSTKITCFILYLLLSFFFLFCPFFVLFLHACSQPTAQILVASGNSLLDTKFNNSASAATQAK